ncbi:MAG: lysoplasmalogenase [Pseudomonadota bacterium]
MTGTLILVAGAVAVAILLHAEARGMSRLRAVAKLSAAALFIAYALHNGAMSSSFGLAILFALSLSAIGDAFLLSRHPTAFLGGMAAFALAHASYACAFLTTDFTFSPLTLLTAAVVCVLAFVYLPPILRNAGDFLFPLLNYAGIIAIMTIASGMVGPDAPAAAWRYAAAASIFAISDIAVARDQFLAQSIRNKLWGLPLYFGAQFLFAASV